MILLDKLAEMICFHARCRENGEKLLRPMKLERKSIESLDKTTVEPICDDECISKGYCEHNEVCLG